MLRSLSPLQGTPSVRVRAHHCAPCLQPAGTRKCWAGQGGRWTHWALLSAAPWAAAANRATLFISLSRGPAPLSPRAWPHLHTDSRYIHYLGDMQQRQYIRSYNIQIIFVYLHRINVDLLRYCQMSHSFTFKRRLVTQCHEMWNQ